MKLRFVVLLSLCLPGLLIAVASFRGATPTQDDELAAGWKDLSASVFVERAGGILNSTNANHRNELVEHGWSFLNAASFIGNDQLSTVQSMIDLFAGRNGDRLNAGVAQSVIDSDLENLQQRFAARLASSSDWLNRQSFAEFLKRIETIYNSGHSEDEASQYFSQWMATNDWKSLSPSEQGDLLEGLSRKDQVSVSDMSARWTGSIVVPKTDSYTFELVRQFNNDPHYKLSINGQVVLDTAEETDRHAEFFVSEAVTLTAQAPVSFRLEMSSSDGDVSHSRGGPAAALRWKTDGGQSQFVSTGAFSPPVGFAEGQGLKGEYFSGTDFQTGPLIASTIRLNLSGPGVRSPLFIKLSAKRSSTTASLVSLTIGSSTQFPLTNRASSSVAHLVFWQDTCRFRPAPKSPTC